MGTWTVTTHGGIYFRTEPSWNKKSPKDVINCDEQVGVIDIVDAPKVLCAKDADYPRFALCENGLYLPITDDDGDLLVMTTPPEPEGGESNATSEQKADQPAEPQKPKAIGNFKVGDKVTHKTSGRSGEVEDSNQGLWDMKKVGVRWNDGCPDWSLLADTEVQKVKQTTAESKVDLTTGSDDSKTETIQTVSFDGPSES